MLACYYLGIKSIYWDNVLCICLLENMHCLLDVEGVSCGPVFTCSTCKLKKYVCLHFCPHWSDVKRSQLKSAVVQSKLQSKCLVKCSEFRSMHPSRRRLQVFQSQRFMPTQIWWRTIQLLEKLCYWDVPNWASYPSVSPYPDTGRTHSSYSDPSPPSRRLVWLQWWHQLSFQPEFLIIHC